MAYGNKGTASFVLQLKLDTTPADEAYLGKCMDAGCRIYNTLIRHCRRRIAALRQDREYRSLMDERRSAGNSRRKELSSRLNSTVASYGLTKAGLESFVKVQQHRYRKYIHSQTAQKIANSVWRGVEKALYGDGRQLHFRKAEDFRSLEGKQNTTGIKYADGFVTTGGHIIPVKRHKDDGSAARAYEEEALEHRIKYCRIVRRPMGIKYHYYVQLVLEGTSPIRHKIGKGRAGLDIGTSTAAVVSEKKCTLTVLGAGIESIERKQRVLQRKMDRSRRAANPGNYNQDGTIKRGRKKWKYSNNYRCLRMRYRALCAKRTAALKQWQEETAKGIISQCDTLYVEQMAFKGLQQRSKKTQAGKDGRPARKKRFGRSIQSRAPAQFCAVLKRKLVAAGGTYHEVNTVTFRASQYNHETDTYRKKKLSNRHCTIRGEWVQRDLYSAFLLMNSDRSLEHADRSRCIAAFDTFLQAHNTCISEIKNSGTKVPRSFGFRAACR